jgi:aldehyde:ferredoxin oxidoreductase
MFTAYGTSNRGRGDHTYAWTIQAEEAGLTGAEDTAAYVINCQINKALTDSLGLCDFFTEDYLSPDFLQAYEALTGFDYTPESFKACGRRIYTLERWINQHQGRTRAYDSFISPKFLKPLSTGPQAGKAVDPVYYNAILDSYYAQQGWTGEGLVPENLLKELGLPEE